MATKVEELKNTTTVAEKNGTRGISLLNDHFRNHDTAFTPRSAAVRPRRSFAARVRNFGSAGRTRAAPS